MKRLLAPALFALGLAAAGTLSAPVIADVTTSTSSTTAPVTTTAPATTTVTTTTTPTTTRTTTTTPARPSTLPRGVRVAGIRVGGLTPAQAVATVQEALQPPLRVVVDRSTLLLDRRRVTSAYVVTAVAKARVAPAGTNVRVVVAVRGAPVRAWVAKIGKRFAAPALDASLSFTNGRPVVRDDRAGRALDTSSLARRVISALRSSSRLPVRARTQVVAPSVSADAFRDVIVIDRGANRLYLYDRAKLRRTFPVATGQAVYPTPRGTFHIVVKWKNPWWYPPTSSPWARGLKPVPPGPENPLGTRWMGISAPGVGIHGTDAPTSIGYSVSHGCIRMQVPDAEWLFEQVDIGTTVHIV